MKLWNKFLHTLEACWLCVRFPFLYPRNRFTGKHRVNGLGKILNKLYKKSVLEVPITIKLEQDSSIKLDNIYFKGNNHVGLWKKEKQLIVSSGVDFEIYDLTKILGEKNIFEILGISSYNISDNNFGIQVHIKKLDVNDTTNYGFCYHKVVLVKNIFNYYIYDILDWVDKKILERICFIPTYTELDAMESGWRKAFGIQMCKDLKAAAKKDGYKFRIMQLKEKWGFIHIYLDMYGPEVKKVISKYEDLSWNTCLLCGKPATKISAGWISPFCDDCFPKTSLVYMKKWKNGKWHETKEHKKKFEYVENNLPL